MAGDEEKITVVFEAEDRSAAGAKSYEQNVSRAAASAAKSISKITGEFERSNKAAIQLAVRVQRDLQAIERAGGSSAGVYKLHAAEIQRLESTFKTLGVEGPKSFQKIAAGAEASRSGLTKFFDGIKDAWKQVGIASAAVVAGFYAIKKAADQASEIANVKNAFDYLTKSIGGTADTMLTKLRTATRGMVSDFELMKQTNQAVALGVAKNEDQFTELLSAARRLGKTLGIDVNYALQSLVTGLGRQSRLFLDNLGIIVDTDQAYKDYAKSIGTTSDKLTVEQQKIAFTNAAFEAMRETISKLGPETEVQSSKVQKAWVDIQNKIDELLTSEAVQLFLGTIGDLIAKVVEDITAIVNMAISLIKGLWDAVPKEIKDFIGSGTGKKTEISEISAQSLLGIGRYSKEEWIAAWKKKLPELSDEEIAKMLGFDKNPLVRIAEDFAAEMDKQFDKLKKKAPEHVDEIKKRWIDLTRQVGIYEDELSMQVTIGDKIVGVEALRNRLLAEAVSYSARITEDMRQQAGYAEDVIKNWGQLTVGAAGVGEGGIDIDVEPDWDALKYDFKTKFGPTAADTVADAFAEGFSSALDNLGNFMQALQRAITAAATKGLELAFGDSFWGKIGSAIGGSLVGSLFGWMFGGGGEKIDPKDYAKSHEEVMNEYFDLIDKYIEKGKAISESMTKAMEHSLTYQGVEWVDKIEEVAQAYDDQAEAIYEARNQLYDYNQQLMQGRMALWNYHKQLYQLRNSIRETRASLLELARAEEAESILRYTRPEQTVYGRGAAGERWSYTTPAESYAGMPAYEQLLKDIEDLPTNKYGQIRWQDTLEMISRVNPAAQQYVLQLIEQLNQKAYLQIQIDNQKRAIEITKHQRDILKNNLPEMRTKLGRIGELLQWMREHWEETAPEDEGGQPGKGDGRYGGGSTSGGAHTQYSTTTYNVNTTTSPTVVIPIQIDGKIIKQIVLSPDVLRGLEVERRRQSGIGNRTMRG